MYADAIGRSLKPLITETGWLRQNAPAAVATPFLRTVVKSLLPHQSQPC